MRYTVFSGLVLQEHAAGVSFVYAPIAKILWKRTDENQKSAKQEAKTAKQQ
jgi:hypothetical protein